MSLSGASAGGKADRTTGWIRWGYILLPSGAAKDPLLWVPLRRHARSSGRRLAARQLPHIVNSGSASMSASSQRAQTLAST
jgi:hypothetical protein